MAVEAKSFAAMPQLRMLLLGNNVRLEVEDELFPKTLKWLRWRIPEHLKSLPACVVHLENIVILDLSWSSSITQLWNPQTSARMKVFEKLKVLNLRRCISLMVCPDFTSMPHLEKLDFHGCAKLSRLHPSIGHLTCLTHLSLGGCVSLEELPQEVGQLVSLQELRLHHCGFISTLPFVLGDFKSLRLLYLSGTNITTLPEPICSLPNLEELNVANCRSLASLPHLLGNLRSLRKLDFSCTDIEELPDSMLLLENLEVVRFAHCYQLKVSQASVVIRLMVLKNRNGVSSVTAGDGGLLRFDKRSERRHPSQILQLLPSQLTVLSDPDDPKLDSNCKLDSIAKQLETLNLKRTLWLMDALAIDESDILGEARKKPSWLTAAKISGGKLSTPA